MPTSKTHRKLSLYYLNVSRRLSSTKAIRFLTDLPPILGFSSTVTNRTTAKGGFPRKCGHDVIEELKARNVRTKLAQRGARSWGPGEKLSKEGVTGTGIIDPWVQEGSGVKQRCLFFSSFFPPHPWSVLFCFSYGIFLWHHYHIMIICYLMGSPCHPPHSLGAWVAFSSSILGISLSDIYCLLSLLAETKLGSSFSLRSVNMKKREWIPVSFK